VTCTGSSCVAARPGGCSAIPANGILPDHTPAVRGDGHGRPRTGQAMRMRRPCTTGRRRLASSAGNSFTKEKAHEQQSRFDRMDPRGGPLPASTLGRRSFDRRDRPPPRHVEECRGWQGAQARPAKPSITDQKGRRQHTPRAAPTAGASAGRHRAVGDGRRGARQASVRDLSVPTAARIHAGQASGARANNTRSQQSGRCWQQPMLLADRRAG
jgi:hypothetical protein